MGLLERFLSKAENCDWPLDGGEGGIRTLGSLLDYGALAKRCFRPLSHLTLVWFYLYARFGLQVKSHHGFKMRFSLGVGLHRLAWSRLLHNICT